MVQGTAHDAHSAATSPEKQLVGLSAALGAATLSGFAGALIEWRRELMRA